LPSLRQLTVLCASAAAVLAGCSASHHSSASGAHHSRKAAYVSSTTTTGGGGAAQTTTTTTAPGSTGVTTPPSTTAGQSTPAPHPAPGAKPGLDVAAGGVYQVAQSGSMTAGSTTTAFPAQGTLAVSPSQHGQQAWLRHFQTGQHPLVSVVRLLGGPKLAQITLAAPQGDLQCALRPLVPAPVWPAVVGASFRSTGDCGGTTLSLTGKVTSERTVSVGGKSYTAWVTDETLSFSGAIVASGTQEDWYVPQIGLPAHESIQISGHDGPTPFGFQLTSDLLSAQPS
jgi:hypothetical protein